MNEQIILESSTLLSCDKFRIINESISILVIHVKDRVNHVDELLICKDLRGSLRRCIRSHVFTFLDCRALNEIRKRIKLTFMFGNQNIYTCMSSP